MEEQKESNQLVGEANLMMMPESSTLERISTYIAKNKLKAALEVEVKYVIVEARKNEVHLEGPGKDFDLEPPE